MPFWGGNPNWLLRSLIMVSLAIHIVIFMHITGLYRSRMLTYIELTLKDVSKPPTRSIPRPRHRPKPPEKPREIKRLKVKKKPIPHFKPIKVEPSERELPDSLVEMVSQPDIPNYQGLNISDWAPGEMETGVDYYTSVSYIEIVRLKIDQHKKYPRLARVKHMEGIVTIRFTITPEGIARALEIAKRSRYRILDRAALRAVKDASPFPKPPGHIYQGYLDLEVEIVFELAGRDKVVIRDA